MPAGQDHPELFHGERPVLELGYAALVRGAERWRGIQLSVFETRQPKAICQELDEPRQSLVSRGLSHLVPAMRLASILRSGTAIQRHLKAVGSGRRGNAAHQAK